MTGFIKPNCQLTVGEIAALTHAKLRDGDPADRCIGNIAPLDSAGPFDISFLDNSKYLDVFANTRAIGIGAILGGRAGVMSDVPDGARWAGTPAEPAIDWKRGVAVLRRLRRKNRSHETKE
ncbi:MAG: LpxD N-terminal domain-containing protein [Xanthobacteraceae bacterium]